jgi:hypothetical protein
METATTQTIANSNDPIIFVGTGRSGTSVTAGMLYYMGVHMGNDFVPADRNNPTGHFEDRAFTDLIRQFAKGELAVSEFKEQMKILIAERQDEAYEHNCRWGWKIPVTTNVLPYIDEICNELRLDPDYVLCWRSPDAVVDSIKRAYGYADGEAGTFVYTRVKQLEDSGFITLERTKHDDGSVDIIGAHVASDDVTLVDFDMLISQPQVVAEQLNNELELGASNDTVEYAHKTLVNDGDKNKGVLFAIPNDGWLHSLLVPKLYYFFDDVRERHLMLPTNLSPVDNARNTIVAEFLKPENSHLTHLWFIDNDTIPPAHALQALLKADAPVVVGVTPTQKYDHLGRVRKVPMVFVEDVPNREDATEADYGIVPTYNNHGVHQIDLSGASCMLIRRDVLEQMEPPWFKNEFDEQGFRTRGEDLYFCKKLQNMGIPLYANFDVQCTHVKEVMLTGSD